MGLAAIPALADDGSVHVVVESPRGSSLKLKYEPRWNAMGISRPLPVGLVFPARVREECVAFTIAAAALEGKEVVVQGWGDPAEARALISDTSVRS
jgi:inorganic pyrophosphatase